MIGNYPDFQVREYSLDWWKIGEITDADMVEIETAIEAQYIVPEIPQEEATEEPTEELIEEVIENLEATE